MTALVLVCAAVCAAEEPYHWPLDLPRQITSSFGEYRRGRLHAAIDLRTGDIGKSVYAARDGNVVRVRCSPWGYGKAVYLRLDDGRTVVYAHLDGFDEPIASYVRKAQHARESYTVDLYPEPGVLPVTRGQRIAFSGQTGVGVPHLHFEIRDSANRPIDPRKVGIDWPDNTRPIVRKIAAAPRTPDDRVNGDIVPQVLRVTNISTGHYRTDPVRASGAIGFGVDVTDPANEGANKLGIRELRVMQDGELRFRMQHEVLSYDRLGGGEVAYHPQLIGEGRFLLGWRWTDNRLESYARNTEDGWVTIGGEACTVTLQLEDFHGNAAEIEIPIEPDREDASESTAQSDGSGSVSLDVLGESLIVTAGFPSAEGEAPTLTLDGPAPASGGSFIRVSGNQFRAGYMPSADGQLTVRVDHPRIAPYERTVEVFTAKNRARTVQFGDMRVSVPANAAFGPLYLRGYTLSDPPGSSAVTAHGEAYMLWPINVPLQESLTVSIPRPASLTSTAGSGLYRMSGSYWASQSTNISGGRYAMSSGGAGAFRVMVDSEEPRISSISPSSESPPTSSRPTIRAKVSDAGSGIVGIRFTVDGRWILAAWDPETGWVTWERDEDLASGERELVIAVTDRAGNTATARRSFTIP